MPRLRYRRLFPSMQAVHATEWWKWLHAFNVSPWEGHKRGAVKIALMQGNEIPEGAELITTFRVDESRGPDLRFDNGVEVSLHQVWQFAEFNDFDFGERLPAPPDDE